MMTREEAEISAEKRERHKSKHMTHKRWAAVHDSVRGWHAALVDCPAQVAKEAHRKALDAFHSGDGEALIAASNTLMMARVHTQLAALDPESAA